MESGKDSTLPSCQTDTQDPGGGLAKLGWRFSSYSQRWELWDRLQVVRYSWLDGPPLLELLQRHGAGPEDRIPISEPASPRLRVWIKAAAELEPFYLRLAPADTIGTAKRLAAPWVRRMRMLAWLTEHGWSRQAAEANWAKPTGPGGRVLEFSNKGLEALYAEQAGDQVLGPQAADEIELYFAGADPLPDECTLERVGLVHNDTLGFQPAGQHLGRRVRAIGEPELLERGKTGDLLLFDNPVSCANCLIKCCTRTSFDHVAMLVRVPPKPKQFKAAASLYDHHGGQGELMLIEAVGTGVRFGPWSRLASGEARVDPGVIHLRPLIAPLSPDQCRLILEECRRMDGREWNQDIDQLVGAWAGQDMAIGSQSPSRPGKQPEAVFCSELVAHLYQVGGVLPAHHRPNAYLPKDFATESNSRMPPLQRGAYLSSRMYEVLYEARHSNPVNMNDELRSSSKYRNILKPPGVGEAYRITQEDKNNPDPIG